jgi:two-component system response regulator (stage 0 sporulation protein F)
LQTILIVDDQKGIRRLLEEVFREPGYKVLTAADGMEALARCRKKKPDLVLLDVKMPGMDGLEVLRIIVRDYPGVSVLMMTAYGELQIIDEALNLGARGYINKPFDVLELLRLTESLLANVGGIKK